MIDSGWNLMNKLTNKQKTTLLYGFLFGYVLSFVFAGRVYYEATALLTYDTTNQVLVSMFFHMIGLLIAGVLIKNRKAAKQTMILSILVCIVFTPFFLISEVVLGYFVIVLVSFFSGLSVACWAAYYKEYSLPEDRMQVIVQSVLIANILMVIAGLIATYLSVIAGFIIVIIYLVLSLCALLSFRDEQEMELVYENRKLGQTEINTLLIFFLFVTVATIDSGLMYGIINLKYETFSELTSWFWAIPYILAFGIVGMKLKRKNELGFVYAAFCLIGFGFLFNVILPFSAFSYIIIDICLLVAAAIIDLFWVSKIGVSFEYLKNPMRVESIAWAANVCGVLIGSILSSVIVQLGLDEKDLLIIALIVIVISIMIMPVMIKRLYLLLESNKFIETYQEQSQDQKIEFENRIPNYHDLTNREQEILQQILRGKSNKEISTELYISENTVKTHVRNILQKYNVTNRAQLISKIWQKEH